MFFKGDLIWITMLIKDFNRSLISMFIFLNFFGCQNENPVKESETISRDSTTTHIGRSL